MLGKIICLLLVLGLGNCLSAWSCGPRTMNVTCSCTNKSVECDGHQDGSYDIETIIFNISSSYHPPGTVDYVIINIENLILHKFHYINIKNLKLGSGLSSFPDDYFTTVNESLSQLNLNDNAFPNVPSNALQVLSKLHFLDLSKNKIVSLTQNDFKGLVSLKILNLQHNSLTLMISEPFSHLKDLEELYLDNNNLHNIESHIFNNLGNLKILSLALNQIQILPENVVQGLSMLRKIILDSNSISHFSNIDIISSVQEISNVNCSSGDHLEKETFKNLHNLTSLDLSNNLVQEIQSNALLALQNLQVLNLSDNNIEIIQDNAFSNLHNLEILNLENNNVLVMATSVFYNLTKLKHLNMNGNKLSGFVCEYTSDLISLETIELTHNQLKVIRAGTFKYSPNLKNIKLEGNILECSCLASYFAEYLQNNTLLDSSDIDVILCDSPTEHRNKRIIDIDYRGMKCIASVACTSSFLLDDDYEYETTTPAVFATTQNKSVTTTTNFFNATANSPTEETMLVTETEPTNETTDILVSTVTNSAATETTAFMNSTASVLTTISTFPMKSIPPTKAEIDISTHSLVNSNLCFNWTIASFVHFNISCSISDKTKRITKKLPCPRSSGYYEEYCLKGTEDNYKVCINLHITETNKLIGTTCFSATENLRNVTEATDSSISEKTVNKTELPPKLFNFTYFNITPLNSTASHIEWETNRIESTRVCHLNVSILSDSSVAYKLFPCKDGSLVHIFQHGITHTVCLTAYHLDNGAATPVCHNLLYMERDADAVHTASVSDTTLPIAVLVGLLIIAICIAIFLAMRSILRKRTASDHYSVHDREKKVRRREARARSSSQSIRYSYTVTENPEF